MSLGISIHLSGHEVFLKQGRAFKRAFVRAADVALEGIALSARRNIRRTITTGAGGPPLKDFTEKRRIARGNPPGPAWKETGRLYNAIEYKRAGSMHWQVGIFPGRTSSHSKRGFLSLIADHMETGYSFSFTIKPAAMV